MARQASTVSVPADTIPANTLVVDSGAYSIKAGFSNSDDSDPDTTSLSNCQTIPNCIARSRHRRDYVGSDVSKCTDYGEMAFKRPVEKGYIVNWEAQKAIWDHEFLDAKSPLHCDPTTTNFILTEPANSPHALQTNTDQIVFEEYNFASLYRCLGPTLAAWNDDATLFSEVATTTSLPTEIMLQIDSGHSHTTIVPIFRGRALQSAIKRIDIGGKHLSNYLAELLSLRHFSLIDEPYIISQIKEDACFVSLDFERDLERTWKGGLGDRRPIDAKIVKDYVLPDYEKLHRGYLREHDASHAAKMARLGVGNANEDGEREREEAFPLANERFVVPELLFNPRDVGLQQSGIAETVMQSLESLPQPMWQGFLGNIVLVGGCSLLPGFVERVESGIRMLAPAEIEVRVTRPDDPIKYTWHGGARLAATEHLKNAVITREQYLEHGERWTREQFAKKRIVQDWTRG